VDRLKTKIDGRADQKAEVGKIYPGSRHMSNVLTDPQTLVILLQEISGDEMQGTIRVKGSCPVCKKTFEHVKRMGYICQECKTVPKRFYIDLSHDGARFRIFSDKQGKVLDTYVRADDLLKVINYEIKAHTFDPSHYVKSQIEKYWAINLLPQFLEHKLKEVAPSSSADLKRKVRIASEFFGTKDVREIRKIDIVGYKEHCEKNFSWSPKTLKDNLDQFKTFLYWLKNDLELIDNVPHFPEIEVSEPSIKWLSAKDQIALFEKVPDADKPIIAFLMLHGCRPGEARAIKCKDVDLEGVFINCHATFSNNVYKERRKGRGAKSYAIPIHPEMRGYVEDRVNNSLPEAFLFINPRTGNCYYESSLRKIWDKTRAQAGIGKELRLYDACRHSFASQLINSGVSLFTVSKMLGHSSTKMTEKYAHEHIEAMRTQLEKLTLKKERSVTRLSLATNGTRKN